MIVYDITIYQRRMVTLRVSSNVHPSKENDIIFPNRMITHSLHLFSWIILNQNHLLSLLNSQYQLLHQLSIHQLHLHTTLLVNHNQLD